MRTDLVRELADLSTAPRTNGDPAHRRLATPRGRPLGNRRVVLIEAVRLPGRKRIGLAPAIDRAGVETIRPNLPRRKTLSRGGLAAQQRDDQRQVRTTFHATASSEREQRPPANESSALIFPSRR